MVEVVGDVLAAVHRPKKVPADHILVAGVVGLVAFGHTPDLGAIVGMAIIIASGLVMAYVQGRQPRPAL